MATTATVNGTDLPLKLGSTSTTTKIINLLGNSSKLSTDTRKTTTKDSGTYNEYKATRNDATLDFNGLFNKAVAVNGIEDLIAWKDAGTLIFWELGTGVTGDHKWTGTGIITSLDTDAPDGDNVTFSGSIQNSGDPTYSVYP